MFKPIHDALGRLAERCLALAAGMLATTIEAMQITHLSATIQQLEDTASRFESDGQVEIAQQIRMRAKSLSMDDPALRGEMLLRHLADGIQIRGISHSDTSSPESLGDETAPRRQAGKGKRPKTIPAPEMNEAPQNGELFFPLGSADAANAEGSRTE